MASSGFITASKESVVPGSCDAEIREDESDAGKVETVSDKVLSHADKPPEPCILQTADQYAGLVPVEEPMFTQETSYVTTEIDNQQEDKESVKHEVHGVKELKQFLSEDKSAEKDEPSIEGIIEDAKDTNAGFITATKQTVDTEPWIQQQKKDVNETRISYNESAVHYDTITNTTESSTDGRVPVQEPTCVEEHTYVCGEKQSVEPQIQEEQVFEAEYAICKDAASAPVEEPIIEVVSASLITTPATTTEKPLLEKIVPIVKEIKEEKLVSVPKEEPKSEDKITLPEGSVHLTVLKAKDLQKQGMFGKADPYTKITLGKQTFKSSTVDNNQNPEWNFDVTFDILKDSPEEITIEVFDEDFGKDDKMGLARVSLHEIAAAEVNKWIDLEQCKSGQVLISAKYLPIGAKPAPKEVSKEDTKSHLKKDEPDVKTSNEEEQVFEAEYEICKDAASAPIEEPVIEPVSSTLISTQSAQAQEPVIEPVSSTLISTQSAPAQEPVIEPVSASLITNQFLDNMMNPEPWAKRLNKDTSKTEMSFDEVEVKHERHYSEQNTESIPVNEPECIKEHAYVCGTKTQEQEKLTESSDKQKRKDSTKDETSSRKSAEPIQEPTFIIEKAENKATQAEKPMTSSPSKNVPTSKDDECSKDSGRVPVHEEECVEEHTYVCGDKSPDGQTNKKFHTILTCRQCYLKSINADGSQNPDGESRRVRNRWPPPKSSASPLPNWLLQREKASIKRFA